MRRQMRKSWPEVIEQRCCTSQLVSTLTHINTKQPPLPIDFFHTRMRAGARRGALANIVRFQVAAPQMPALKSDMHTTGTEI